MLKKIDVVWCVIISLRIKQQFKSIGQPKYFYVSYCYNESTQTPDHNILKLHFIRVAFKNQSFLNRFKKKTKTNLKPKRYQTIWIQHDKGREIKKEEKESQRIAFKYWQMHTVN